ncbi:linear amide C-N hydrolase, partial [Staphylococcus aureus]|uniref:linear amide C-N hydrolase n=1 Tax=Staphylococcus aureus TaxID=1280 RepID=UPI0037DA6002
MQPLPNQPRTFPLPPPFTSTHPFLTIPFIKPNIPQNNHKQIHLINPFYLLDPLNIPIPILPPHHPHNHYTIYHTLINLTTTTLYINYYG